MKTINRKPGAPEEKVYRTEEDDIGSTTHSKAGVSTHSKKSGKKATGTELENGEMEDSSGVVKAILPKYEIDSTSENGLKPETIQGRLEFKDVKFIYPTRPHEPILNGLSTVIEPGQTVAFVGPRYLRPAPHSPVLLL